MKYNIAHLPLRTLQHPKYDVIGLMTLPEDARGTCDAYGFYRPSHFLNTTILALGYQNKCGGWLNNDYNFHEMEVLKEYYDVVAVGSWIIEIEAKDDEEAIEKFMLENWRK